MSKMSQRWRFVVLMSGAPQWIFGLGRRERLGGTRTLVLSCPMPGSSLLGLVVTVAPGPLRSPTAVHGGSDEARLGHGARTWDPALKQGRPLVGGGNCLVLRLASNPEEPLRGPEPPVPPCGSAGMDTRLWRQGACRTRR